MAATTPTRFIPRGAPDAAADHLAIQELTQLYAYALDARDLDLFDEIFAPDAVIEIKLFGVFDRDSWRESSRGISRFDATMHFCGPPVIRVAGESADSRCYFMAQHALNELRPDPFLMVGGTYDDHLEKRAGRWWITHRTGTSAWWQGNPAVLGSPIEAGGIPWMDTRSAPPWLFPSL